MKKPFDPAAYDRRTKIGLLAVSVVTLALLIGAALLENLFPQWRSLRSEYADILEEKAVDESGQSIAAMFEIDEIQQNVLPELERTDRCITCHTGVSDPRMTDVTQPFKTHPGNILNNHPLERFGCTTCHEGQGLATTATDAHGHTEDWLYPIYERDYMYSSCATCHEDESVWEQKLVAAEGTSTIETITNLVAEGKTLVDTKGCIGCHVIDGTGGTMGPDITFVGDKTRHDFDFSHFHGEEHTVAAWLHKHFVDPGELSPGTSMPDMNLSEKDAVALTAYVLSLRSKDVPLSYAVPRSVAAEPPAPLTGKEMYEKMCSACHGVDGRESDVPGIRTPALNNPDLLAVASDNYLGYIIDRGRSNTSMPGWGPAEDGISYEEIDQIVAYIRGWEAEGADVKDVLAFRGNKEAGRGFYAGLCANCHGESGDGGIGIALNSPTFLGIATDQFLAESIIHGRPGTAMASWKHLDAQSVSDLVAHIRNWQPKPPPFEEVQKSLAAYTVEDNREFGEGVFVGNCVACHGQKGEGGIGVRLNSPNIIPAVSDEFLYKTIAHGRSATAMPAWPQLNADQMAGLITYMRSWQDGPKLELAKAPSTGDYDVGQVHFKLACVQCHGEQGEGGVGPRLINSDFLDTATNDVLYHWIAHGRTGTAMEGFLETEQGIVELESDDIMDVVAYLRHAGNGNSADVPLVRTGLGNPVLGEELYTQTCASCHGQEGEGASGPQLRNPTFLRTASDGFLSATIALGRDGTAMLPMVHGFQGVGQLDPNSVQDIIAYMRLWEKEDHWGAHRPVAEISERAIRSGRASFAEYCAGCHGPNGYGVEDGEGHFAPALNNPEFLEAASDGFLLATIARGRSNTPMRPFGDNAGGIVSLDAEAIFDIVSYIRSWQEEYLPEGD
jgi:cbb3-type cytochrome c oxidase subunit III